MLEPTKNKLTVILIFGVKEHNEETLEACVAAKLIAKNTIMELGNSVSLAGIKLQRIERYDRSKIRPIRVVMVSHQDVIKILRKRFELKGEIYIKSDMIQLKLRTSRGESDLKIWYIEGIPKTVKTHTSKN